MARERWPNRLIFIFAAVGSAAGLGNLWRFPYMAYTYGGGAFLLPYFLALLIIGIPLLILEFGLGRTFQASAVGALRKIRPWAGTIGWWALGCGFVILSYYAVVMAWSLRYFFASFTTAWSGGAKDYFFTTVLNASPGIGALGGFNWPLLLCLVGVWLMIYFSIWKGVSSVSKVVKITMPLPIILLLVLLVRAVTLPGAGEGILAYITPSLAPLLDVDVWLAAAAQIFFTLTLGFGVMIAYASYSDKKQDTAGDTLWTALLNSGISIIAGFVVFGTLGYLAMQSGVPIGDVATQGVGLAFVVFPQALSLMPLPWLFSLLFFLVLLSLGIDSAFSLIEGIVAAFRERIRADNTRIALVASAICFVAGLVYVTGAGLYFLDVIDHFINRFGLVLVGISTALVVGWTKTGEQVKDELAKTSTWFPIEAWWWTIRLVAPLALVFLVIWNLIDELRVPYGDYPAWALGMAWAAVFLPLAVGWFLNRWYGRKEAAAARKG